MSAERGASIRALERGIEVLRLLGPQEGSSLRALHAASALPKPTLLRILHTLERGGLAWRSIEDGLWRRSQAWAAAPSGNAIDPRLVEAAAPHLVALQRTVLWPSDLLVYRDFAMEVAESSRRLSGLALAGEQAEGEVELARTGGARQPVAQDALGLVLAPGLREQRGQAEAGRVERGFALQRAVEVLLGRERIALRECQRGEVELGVGHVGHRLLCRDELG